MRLVKHPPEHLADVVMLKTKAGDIIGTGPAQAQVDAESVDQTAKATGLGRTTIYKALNPDPAKREGLPFLPSMKVRKRRLIRTETRRAWLKQLEELQSVAADKGS
jgi:hypothetical protein